MGRKIEDEGRLIIAFAEGCGLLGVVKLPVGLLGVGKPCMDGAAKQVVFELCFEAELKADFIGLGGFCDGVGVCGALWIGIAGCGVAQG